MQARANAYIWVIVLVVLLVAVGAGAYMAYLGYEEMSLRCRKAEVDKLAPGQTVALLHQEVAELQEKVKVLSFLVGGAAESQEGVELSVETNPATVVERLNGLRSKLPGGGGTREGKEEGILARFPALDINKLKAETMAPGLNLLVAIKALEEEIGRLSRIVERKNDQLQAKEQSLVAQEAGCNKERQLMLSEKAELKAQAERDLVASREKLAALTQELDAVRLAKTRLQRDGEAKLQELTQLANSRQSDIHGLNTQLRDLRRARTGYDPSQPKFFDERRTDPDGEILLSQPESGLAYLDLGMKSGVMPGTRFVVFRFGKGGLAEPKGMVEILKVHDDLSEASIYPVERSSSLLNAGRSAEETPLALSSYDVVAKGDKIANPIFSRDRARKFALVGHFTPEDGRYGKEDLEKMLKDLGVTVEPEAGVQTDVVVVGGKPEDYENEEGYKLAVRMGIELMTVRQLVRYLKN